MRTVELKNGTTREVNEQVFNALCRIEKEIKLYKDMRDGYFSEDELEYAFSELKRYDVEADVDGLVLEKIDERIVFADGEICIIDPHTGDGVSLRDIEFFLQDLRSEGDEEAEEYEELKETVKNARRIFIGFQKDSIKRWERRKQRYINSMFGKENHSLFYDFESDDLNDNNMTIDEAVEVLERNIK